MDPLEALADCIMRFEGWLYPASTAAPRGSTSWRNRNPGNLRDSSLKSSLDEKGYAIFPSLGVGFDALKADLYLKSTGKSKHNLTPQSSLFDLFNIYAPSIDQNDPEHYCRSVCLWLSQIYNSQVIPSMRLEDFLKLGQ